MGEFLWKYVSRKLLALSEGEIAALTTAMRQLGVGSQGGAEALASFHQLLLMPHLHLDILGPYPHLMGQPSRRRPTCCNAPLLDLKKPYLLTYDVLDLHVALASTCLGSVSLALLPGLNRLPTGTHSPTALQKSVQLENTTVSPLSPLHPNGKERFLKTSMAHSTLEAYEYGRHLDHAGRIADSPNDKTQKAARALLRDEIPKGDFSPPFATRASKIVRYTRLQNLGTDQQTPHGTNHTDDS